LKGVDGRDKPGHDEEDAMAEIRVPALGESVTEATIGKWFKKPGDAVAVDEPLVELETDKVTIEVPAPAAGVLGDIAAKDGETVAVGALLGSIKQGAAAAPAGRPEQKAEPQKTAVAGPEEIAPRQQERSAEVAPPTRATPPKPAAAKPAPAKPAPAKAPAAEAPLAPSVRKLAAESGMDATGVPGTGKDGRVTKGDMLAAIERAAAQPTPVATPAAAIAVRAPTPPDDAAREERVRMTRLRQTIARRLKDAQNTAAMLTTFNEVDMSEVIALRTRYRDLFEKKHGIKLGFMGLFVRACVQALKEIPSVNAEIDGADIVYKNYYHIGIAVGTERGLVVPVVRDCEQKSLAEIEKAIADFGRRAREGSLKIEELQGGTFTITNGGIYGSLMSTPILNAPQSGILGMHKIQERPVAVSGKVEVRPMMYLALSYDHRIVDGREAVTFLVRVKECLEEPARLVLDL
jgi:2-oxoglutarate dehydrogenase E2 component (dihydrolipoamide succinyltransferase)